MMKPKRTLAALPGRPEPADYCSPKGILPNPALFPNGVNTPSLRSVAVLFARADSVYKTLPGCDVYDLERNALTWTGGCPCIVHPPCRAWGRLRHFARPRKNERELALWAVTQVRMWGGVLEHPAASQLWSVAELPQPGSKDRFGGWSFPVFQWWFGHRAEKATLLYIVGIEPADLPPYPFKLGEATHVVAQHRTLAPMHRLRKGMRGWKPEISKRERELTPIDFARWLVELARRTQCVHEAPTP